MGRVATRAPRAEDRIDMIRDLAMLRKIQISAELLSSIKKTIKQVAEKRDVIAHGSWVKEFNQWHAVKVTGTWPDTDNPPIKSRRILPEALLADTAQLRTLTEALDKVIMQIGELEGVVEKQIAKPPEEHPEQFAPADRAQDRKPAKRQPRKK